jgi:D-alanyl-lipoteichoic acid acyltransferase DltB (MBOAT superfamily)
MFQLTLFGLPFVILAAIFVAFIILAVLVENEHFVGSFIAVVASMAALHYLQYIDVVTAFRMHLSSLPLLGLGYIVAGVAFCTFRFWRFLVKLKERLIGWIAFWPFALVGWVINDFVREIYEIIYDALASFFQKMADRIMGEPG